MRASDGETAPEQAKDTSLGVRNWQVSAKNRYQWKAEVEAAVELQTL